MKLVTWNVNGIRAAAQHGFERWFIDERADIVCLQETRARPEQLPPSLRNPGRYHAFWHCAETPGYSGVALFSRRAPDAVETCIGMPEMDAEGRLQIARFGNLAVVNGYFPNGNGKDRDNSRVPFKLDFYRAVHARVDALRQSGVCVLVMGDFNTAHREIDLARPKDNRGTSGFLVEECEELDRWLRSGLVDTFRHFEPAPHHYSWWSQRFGVRARNIGWRIDYVLACPAAMQHVRAAWLEPHVQGSDHCPAGVEVDAEILRTR
jgi:exodeoxyribonuclease-3